jgi:hypothetical protein
MPTNFFQRLENDPSHVPWTHRESTLRGGAQPESIVPPLSVTAQERPWGFTITSIYPGRPPHTNYYFMPNADQHNGGSSESGERVPRNRLSWNVPIDDVTRVSFRVDLVRLSGEARKEYEEQLRRSARPLSSPVWHDTQAWRDAIAERVLAGQMRIEDMDRSLNVYHTFRVEDYSTQVGQGRIADRSHEHLGQIDAGTVLRRHIWLRELKALAEGRPLTEWRVPDNLAEMMAEDGAAGHQPALTGRP